MKIPQPVVLATSSGLASLVSVFWRQSVEVMLPWLLVVFAAVIADLASGHYKAGRLGIHFAWSTAIRESLGKIVVYGSAVMLFAMFDVAVEGKALIAKWLCIFVSAVEIGSVFSNILICHGIKLSLKAVLKFILKKSPFGIDDEAADEIIKVARREDKKWNKASSRRFKDDDGSLNAFVKSAVTSETDEDTGRTVYHHNF